ncbi:PucR family transcriptional regulator ligand-binding domain-containing protein [Paenibacillus sp. LHD-117]|uniref:PucR family transcriptional regulator n=1 Tax=Paenibacillus sp. LHD-117 TaxID=3071412 RepID=UPI0027E0F454|nr:PucR family transcriptional regulator ligand-binding domain-containing protein [Paenibacillus sp. LHD-117]MDQ6418079.1 PucR family transcriptional regulator ligand-binding domain-containing protein [Paenibacillus sp. LHD-117]
MLIEELFNHELYRHAKLIGGRDGLARTIQTVNIMDAPDIVHFLRPGELLLTNGYFIKEGSMSLIELIRSMNRIGCCGIAIKSRRFDLSIPQEAIDESDRLAFPLYEISEVDCSLGEMLQRSTSLILDNRNEELQYALAIHKRFSAMIMHGSDLKGIVTALTKLLDAPIVFLDYKLQVAERSAAFRSPGNSALTADTIRMLSSMPVVEKPMQLCLMATSERDRSVLELYPVITYRHEGYLIAYRKDYQTSSSEFGLTMEQASNVIGMELTKRQAVKERSRRYKTEFFSDLIDGFIATEQEAQHRGKRYGLSNNGGWVLLAVRPENGGGGALSRLSGMGEYEEERLLSERDRQYELIKRQFSKLPYSFVMFTKTDLFCVLISLPDQKLDSTSFVKEISALTEQLYEHDKLSVSVGIGNPFVKLLDIGLSFQEASKALQIGYQMKRSRFVQAYRTRDVVFLFRMIPREDLLHFYQETFACFNEVDEAEKAELLRTLCVYYETQCQLVETSRLLFVHRNTVVYRLEKCGKLAGFHLKDPVESLRFRLAFAIEPLLQASAD